MNTITEQEIHALRDENEGLKRLVQDLSRQMADAIEKILSLQDESKEMHEKEESEAPYPLYCREIDGRKPYTCP